MRIRITSSGGRFPRYTTVCPHGYGWRGGYDWGLGSKVPCGVGSAICEYDCPYHAGIDRERNECICECHNTRRP